jgi:hypothetical protein
MIDIIADRRELKATLARTMRVMLGLGPAPLSPQAMPPPEPPAGEPG